MRTMILLLAFATLTSADFLLYVVCAWYVVSCIVYWIQIHTGQKTLIGP